MNMGQVEDLQTMLEQYKQLKKIREAYYNMDCLVYIPKIEIMMVDYNTSETSCLYEITATPTTSVIFALNKAIDKAIQTSVDEQIEALEKKFKTLAVDYWKEIPDEELKIHDDEPKPEPF